MQSLITENTPRISTIIANLANIIEKHGDLPITNTEKNGIYPGAISMYVETVNTYDERGGYYCNVGSDEYPAKEICVIGALE